MHCLVGQEGGAQELRLVTIDCIFLTALTSGCKQQQQRRQGAARSSSSSGGNSSSTWHAALRSHQEHTQHGCLSCAPRALLPQLCAQCTASRQGSACGALLRQQCTRRTPGGSAVRGLRCCGSGASIAQLAAARFVLGTASCMLDADSSFLWRECTRSERTCWSLGSTQAAKPCPERRAIQ